MKSFRVVSLAVAMLSSAAVAQNPPAPLARSDVYHVHVAAAAPGKVAQLGDFLKTPDPNSPMPGHVLVLRHQDGAEWDYVVITHLGTKATVSASGTPTPANVRDMYAWHGDTFVNGPAWPEFVLAMGLGEQTAKSADSVYVVSFYRALPGHRDQLEKRLSALAPGELSWLRPDAAPRRRALDIHGGHALRLVAEFRCQRKQFGGADGQGLGPVVRLA